MLYQSERSSRWKLTADETNGEKSHELSTPSFLRHDSRSLRLRSTMCAPVHSFPPSPSLSIPKSTHALPIFHALLSFHEFFDSRASKLSRRVFAFDVAFPPLFFTREKERNSSLLKRKKKRSVIVLAPMQHVSSGWWDRSLVDARATGWKSFHDRETGWRTVEEEEVPLLSSPDGVETSRWERGG